jgi:hypothetical protein
MLWVQSFCSGYSVICSCSNYIWEKAVYSTGEPRKGDCILLFSQDCLRSCSLVSCGIYFYIFRYLDVNEIQTIHADRLSHLKSLTRLWVLSSSLSDSWCSSKYLFEDVSSGLHGIMSQNTEVFITTTVRTSNPTSICSLNRCAGNIILIFDWSHVISYCWNCQCIISMQIHGCYLRSCHYS